MKRKLWSGLTTAIALCVLVGGFLYAAQAGKAGTSEGPGRGAGTERGQIERALEDLFLGEP